MLWTSEIRKTWVLGRTQTLYYEFRRNLVEDEDPCLLYKQNHSCRWPGNAKSQGIISHGVDLVLWEYSDFSISKATTYLLTTANKFEMFCLLEESIVSRFLSPGVCVFQSLKSSVTSVACSDSFWTRGLSEGEILVSAKYRRSKVISICIYMKINTMHMQGLF